MKELLKQTHDQHIEAFDGSELEATHYQQLATEGVSADTIALLQSIDQAIEKYPVASPQHPHTKEAHALRVSAIVDETYERIINSELPSQEISGLLVSTASTFALIESNKALAERNLSAMRKRLPGVIGTRNLNRIHREVALFLTEHDTIDFDQDMEILAARNDLPNVRSWPKNVVEELFHDLTERKILKGKEEVFNGEPLSSLRLSRPKAADLLIHGHLGTSAAVAEFYNTPIDEVIGLEEAEEKHRAHDEARKVKVIDISTQRDSVKIMPINELRLGHQDQHSGFTFAKKQLTTLTTMPDEDKPDVVLFSNMLQGDFSHNRSRRGPTLSISNNNSQFGLARDMIALATRTNIPVIVNLGPDDRALAEDYAIGVIAELKNAMSVHTADGHIPYYQKNKLMQDKRFNENLKFELDYAIPLSYRLGRSLRTAEEVSVLTNGEVRMSEYLLLFSYIKLGRPLPPELGIDPAMIVGPGETDENGVTIVYQFDLNAHTKGDDYHIQFRHNPSLTPESLTGNHMTIPLAQIGNLGMMGEDLPDLFMTGRAQELAYATRSNVPVLSLPGMADPIMSLNSDGYFSDVAGDVSRRFNATRRRLIKPAIDTIEMMDNGNVVHHIATDGIMEKSRHLPRMRIFVFCDFQTGSPTARADYQIKFLSMVLDAAREMPVAIHFAGDLIHGNIYANMAHEAAAIGLMRPEAQKIALSTMLTRVFQDAPRPLIDAVIDVLIQQGNHDEVQNVRSFGNANNDSNIDYLIRDSKDLFDTPGEETKVRHDAVFLTAEGTPVNTWVGRSHYGPFVVNTAHYHVDRGVKKGDDSGLAAYHALQRARGIGNAELVDLFIGGHWHNEQLMLQGDILSVIGGAIAERSEFEDVRGYDARVAPTYIDIGGGLPTSVTFVHAKALIDQEVKYGYFTTESLNDHGFVDDKDFDPYKHGIYSFDYLPKSALQKSIRRINRDASERIEFAGTITNPNQYDSSGKPIIENTQTSRIRQVQKQLSEQALA